MCCSGTPMMSSSIVIADVELHGAVTLTRWTSDEKMVQFELTSAEVDALVALNRRRRANLRRYFVEVAVRGEQVSEDDLPF